MLAGFSILFAVVVICWIVLWHNSSTLYPTVVHGKRSEQRIALTFDDGPDPEYTTRTLDILARHNAKATFFCLGSLIEEHPGIVQRIHDEGHLIANHGFDHSLRDFFNTPGITHQFIVKTALLIQNITGYFPRFYRPPVGIKTPPRVLSTYYLGATCIGWSHRAVDGGNHFLSPERAARMSKKAKSGDILLLHDGRIGKTGKKLDTVSEYVDLFAETLETLLESIQKKGLKPVRLDDLLQLSAGLEIEPAVANASSWRLIKHPIKALLTERMTPARAGLSLATGIFIGCCPFFGLHTFLGLTVALRLRLHKLAVFIGTNITTPPLAPFVIFACLQTGWWIIHRTALPMSLEALKTYEFPYLLQHFLLSWLIGFPIVGTILGATLGAPLYLILSRRKTKR